MELNTFASAEGASGKFLAEILPPPPEFCSGGGGGGKCTQLEHPNRKHCFARGPCCTPYQYSRFAALVYAQNAKQTTVFSARLSVLKNPTSSKSATF